MRVDSSPILLAGQAQAQANQAFGNAVGGVVEKFYQKKKDKQERDEREQAYLKMGLTSEEAKAASRDKDLANQFINKMNADRNFNLQMLQFKDNEALNAARIASLGDASIGRFADREREIQEQERLLKEAEDLEKKQLKLDRFLTERRKTETPEFSNLQKQFTLDQIPGTPEFKAKELSEPMGARPPLMASVATDKPNFKMFNVGKSEAVARLPESFQPQGVRVIDAVESGRLTPGEGMSLINQIQAQAMAEQKAGPTRSEILAREKYEDEKATRESEKEILNTESTNNLTDFYNETSGLLDKINEKTVDVTGPIEGTSVYRFFSKIGDTDDEQVRRRLEMFTRKLTLDAAQNLKGALSDKDIRFLVEQAPDMDDNPSVWKKYMGDLKTRLERNATQKGINFEDTNLPQQPTPQSRDELLKQEADLQKRLNERLLNNPPMQQFRGI